MVAEMSREQLWVEVRYRLVVVGLATLVAGGFWLAVRSEVRVGPPSARPFVQADLQKFTGEILAWKTGQPALVGLARSASDSDCDSLVMWTKIEGQPAFIGIGPLRAHQQTTWGGYLEDPGGRRVAVGRTEPRPTFTCYHWNVTSQLPSP